MQTPPSTQPILDVRHLTVEFTNRGSAIVATRQVSFQVNPGQTLGIVGESGSGKSVSCLAAMGLIPSPPGQIRSGEIWFTPAQGDPVNLLTLAPDQWSKFRGREIGMIFQEPMTSLNPVFTCGYQVMEAIRQHDAVSVKEAEQRTIALFQEVQLLPSDEVLGEQFAQQFGAGVFSKVIQRRIHRHKQQMLRRFPHQLSGGQRQRVMIAIALSCNPRLLIADEPTTALDVTIQAAILDLLRSLQARRQMSLIFVSHDLGVIGEIADRVAVMYQGEVVEQGAVEDIFSQPQHPYTKGLLACRPRLDMQMEQLPTLADFMEVQVQPDGTLGVKERENAPQLEAILKTVPAAQATPLPPQGDPPLLSVHNLRVEFPVKGGLGRTMTAVDSISFQVWPGETLGLVGESGCGKTTLARALLRLVPISSGQVVFDNQDLSRMKPQALRRLRKDLQIVFQDPSGSLDPRLTVEEAIVEPLLIHGFNKKRSAYQQQVDYLLEKVGLDPQAKRRYPHQFSGGQRQRICIARALALNPRFIICDESVSALDVSVQAQVLNLLKSLQADFNLTYIFISHDLSVVKFMSDRILVMNQGKIEEIAPAHEIYAHPQSDYTRQLIAAIPQLR
ncbi:MAG: ABC transporter ATP-binding protein [Prochlorotrichaceae cyanobacterium]